MKIKKLTEDELNGFQQLPDELKDKPNDSSSELPKNMKGKEDQKEKNKEENEPTKNYLKKINDYMIKYGDKYSNSKMCHNDVEAWLKEIGF